MLLAIVLAFSGGVRTVAAITSRSELTAIIARSPDPQIVPEGQELLTAEKMAARTADAIAYLGIGESMAPLYPSNTAVVVVPVEFDRIRKGMTVVYVSDDGQRIAHCVVGETRDGYLVQGFNNAATDTEVVTARNLIGVIVQAFASAEPGSHGKLAVLLKHKDWAAGRKLPSKS